MNNKVCSSSFKFLLLFSSTSHLPHKLCWPFDFEFRKPRLCSREILKNNVFWTLAGLPSPAGILYLGPKRFLRYMGVGAIRAIQSMTLKMIITRNMGGGAAIQRVLCQSRGGNCPTFQTVMWGPDMSTGDSFTPPPVDLSYNDCSLDATDRTDDMIIILYEAECMKFQQKKKCESKNLTLWPYFMFSLTKIMAWD